MANKQARKVEIGVRWNVVNIGFIQQDQMATDDISRSSSEHHGFQKLPPPNHV